ncbi:hypothetical protein BC830DRAFT_117251 [Chytriomyces sp. MP71]|nr:hypothetical protein BC830DRAFT_117251 [Chytriomyces sp. MP71]
MLPLSLPVEPEALPHLNVSVISASPILSPAVPTNAADDVLNVGAQVSAVRSENVEAGSEIEEFSRSLQRTVNELNTLQDLIRSRGIKALPIVSTTSLQNSLLNMHSENVNNDEHDSDISAVAVGTGVEASNDFSLSSTHQRTDKVDVMEIEVDCFHQDSGPKLTLEDLNFDFADDSGPEEHAVTQEASSVSAAELHRSESNIEVSQEQHRFGHTSPNLSDSLSLSFDSIQRQSRQRKLGSTPMGQTGILKAENGHTAQSLSDEDDDEDTDAFIHSLLKSHRRENSPMISATNDSSPPRPKSSLHMEIKSTAEKYLELTHHQTLHRSHKTQDTDDSLQFPDSDSDSSSDDLYGMYKVVNRHKFADKGSSPLSSDAIVAAVNKSHVRSGRAAQDSRLKKLLALADGQNSDMTDSQSDYSDSDFSLVFASPERKVGGMNKSRASSPNEKAARGTAAKARHADDEEIREILARSRQTRAEALEKVAQMKQSASILEQPPLRKPYAKILSEITFSNSTVDTRPPRVPIRTTADRNASDIFTKGEAERVSRIFKNVK